MATHTKALVEEILSGFQAQAAAAKPMLDKDRTARSGEQSVDEATQTLLADLEALRTEYPELPLTELASDELFIRFARGKGNDFRTICEDFDCFIEAVRQSIKDEERKASAQRRRSGGMSRSGASTFGLSRSQLDFLAAWNRDNPNYAMTPQQYARELRK